MKTHAKKFPLRLKALIDTENAQAVVIKSVLADITRFGGEVAVERICGDFFSGSRTCVSWYKKNQERVIKSTPDYNFSSRKSSANIDVIIDAMDLLHEKNMNVVCLVTSDSDFTGLAMLFKEVGLMTYGFCESDYEDALQFNAQLHDDNAAKIAPPMEVK